MMINFIPDVVIYHNVALDFPCPDGLAAAFVVWLKFREINPNILFIGRTYEQNATFEYPEGLEGKNVLVVDFSFPISTLQILELSCKNLFIIDHHESFMEEIKNQKVYSFDNLIFNKNYCGATLTWKTLFKGENIPEWLLYIQDNDLFDLVLHDTEYFHYGCSKLKRTFGLFEQLHEYCLADNWDLAMSWLTRFGKPGYEKNLAKMNKILDNPKKVTFWGDVPVVTLTKSDAYLKSRIARLAEIRHGSKFSVILVKGESRIRLKTSQKDLNLLKLFAEYKPSGHPPACGINWQNSMKELEQVIIDKSATLI
jgi:nanoRNase/pAp phosphatase (c-di-AMP/oligoRNAs hydrolase)